MTSRLGFLKGIAAAIAGTVLTRTPLDAQGATADNGLQEDLALRQRARARAAYEEAGKPFGGSDSGEALFFASIAVTLHQSTVLEWRHARDIVVDHREEISAAAAKSHSRWMGLPWVGWGFYYFAHDRRASYGGVTR